MGNEQVLNFERVEGLNSDQIEVQRAYIAQVFTGIEPDDLNIRDFCEFLEHFFQVGNRPLSQIEITGIFTAIAQYSKFWSWADATFPFLRPNIQNAVNAHWAEEGLIREFADKGHLELERVIIGISLYVLSTFNYENLHDQTDLSKLSHITFLFVVSRYLLMELSCKLSDGGIGTKCCQSTVVISSFTLEYMQSITEK